MCDSFVGVPKLKGLYAEGNYYHDPARVKNTGIGWHGDTERGGKDGKGGVVVGLRLGAPQNLLYQWYHRSSPIGRRLSIKLNAGDIYFMSQKAVGSDWRHSSQMTLRHAVGAFFDVDVDVEKKEQKKKAQKRKREEKDAKSAT